MRMGRLGEEVSQKVKSAIKAKLMELGIHIDNELPDYVMVLVANKKTQKQMEEDLLLFLGENTKLFTSWLHDVLKKLEKVTSSAKSAKKKVDDKRLKNRRKSLDSDDYDSISTKKFKADEKSDPLHSSNGTQLTLHLDKEEVLSDFEIVLDDKKNYLPEIKENIAQSMVKDYCSTRICSGQKEEVKDNSAAPDSRTSEKDDVKQRERIKIVWEDSKDIKDKNIQMKNKKERLDVKSGRRSKSREKERYKGRKRDRDLTNHEHGKSRGESRHKGRSRSPRYYEKHNNDYSSSKKVLDARDILLKKNITNDHNHRSKKRESTPISKSLSERPREIFNDLIYQQKIVLPMGGKLSPVIADIFMNDLLYKGLEREKQLPSVLKAIVREPQREEKPSVPSLVKVTPRPVRPASMQPSCNLILRAVADAEKSVATTKINQKLIDTVSKRHFEYEDQGSISVTLVNDRVTSTKPNLPKILENEHSESSQLSSESNIHFNELNENAKTEDDTISMVVDSEDYIESMDSQDVCLPSKPPVKKVQSKNGTKKEKSGKRFIITLDSTASDNELEADFDVAREANSTLVEDCVIKSEADSEIVPEVPVKQPFDRSRLGPKIEENTNSDFNKVTSTTPSLTPMDISEITQLEAESADSLKNPTKCKFWPGCEAGDLCSYYHPTTLCRMFPSCLYGDKCLYIHPACKFADKCLNTSCPYTHTSKTPKPKVPLRTAPIPSSTTTQVCMYFPKCAKPFCPYLHISKPCRFGTTCSKLGCEFSHPGSKNPYKWVARQ